jgi:hypothetical protein
MTRPWLPPRAEELDQDRGDDPGRERRCRPAALTVDAVKLPTCHYAHVGETDGNLTGLLAAKGITTPFDVPQDSAAGINVHGQPGRANGSVRALERAAATLSGDNLATGQTEHLTSYMADLAELRILHMVTGDPKRTPSLVLFDNPDFWLQPGPASCGASCFSEPAGGDAWNHGVRRQEPAGRQGGRADQGGRRAARRGSHAGDT